MNCTICLQFLHDIVTHGILLVTSATLCTQYRQVWTIWMGFTVCRRTIHYTGKIHQTKFSAKGWPFFTWGEISTSLAMSHQSIPFHISCKIQRRTILADNSVAVQVWIFSTLGLPGWWWWWSPCLGSASDKHTHGGRKFLSWSDDITVAMIYSSVNCITWLYDNSHEQVAYHEPHAKWLLLVHTQTTQTHSQTCDHTQTDLLTEKQTHAHTISDAHHLTNG